MSLARKLLALASGLSLLAMGCGSGETTGDTQHSRVSGELEVLVANYGSHTQPLYGLKLDNGVLLDLVFERYPGLITGDRISAELEPAAEGRFRVKDFMLEELDGDVDAVEQSLTAQPVTRTPKVALLLVNWTAPSSYTATTARDDLIGSTTSVRAHFLESSYGQTSVTGDTFGWYTIPAPNGCDYRAIRTNAEAAAQAAGVNLTTYQHIGIIFPRFSTCGWAGLGEQGAPGRVAKYTWYNGPSKSVVSHELGHNFGMYHARSYSCGSAAMAAPSACSFVEYGDVIDPMGRGGQLHFNAYTKKMQSWFGKCNVVNAPSGGTFDIVPLGAASDAVQAVQVPMNAGLCPTADSPGMQGCQYMLEYRTQIGFDRTVPQGLFIHATSRAPAPAAGVRNTTATNPFLLDMTPATGTNFRDGALVVGQTFTDPNGITIKLVSSSATKATVQVVIPGGTGAATCLDGTTFSGTPPGPSCTDGVKNGNETAVDCGGSCTKCANGATCGAAVDCQSGICTSGTCSAPPTASCTDGVKNGNETAVDCGGSCTKCANGATCGAAVDCQSGICTAGTCSAPPTASCTDGVKNGSETAVDCGGSCAKCANGATCGAAADCQSGICTSGTCSAPPTASCTDGVKNGSETAVDCGGSCAKCANGATCGVAADCASNTCSAGTCTAPPTTGGLSAAISITNDWGGGYCANVEITNGGTTAITRWTTVLDLHQSAFTGGWNASITTSGTSLTAISDGWNAQLGPGAKGPFGFCANKIGSNWMPTVTSVR